MIYKNLQPGRDSIYNTRYAQENETGHIFDICDNNK